MHTTKIEKPRQNRWRFSLRTAFIAVACIAVYLSLYAIDCRKASTREEAFGRLEDKLYTWCNVPYKWSLGTGWLHRLVGDTDPPTLGFAVFNNFAYVNDDTLRDLSVFQELHDVCLGGEIEITETGMWHLRQLHNLDTLDLAEAPVNEDSVAALRLALPRCTIRWREDEQ